MEVERVIIFTLFGVSLALFAWRHKTSVASAWDVASAVPQEEIPDMPAVLAYSDPAFVVGMSYTPDSGGPNYGPAIYTANAPETRPAMPPLRNAAK